MAPVLTASRGRSAFDRMQANWISPEPPLALSLNALVNALLRAISAPRWHCLERRNVRDPPDQYRYRYPDSYDVRALLNSSGRRLVFRWHSNRRIRRYALCLTTQLNAQCLKGPSRPLRRLKKRLIPFKRYEGRRLHFIFCHFNDIARRSITTGPR